MGEQRKKVAINVPRELMTFPYELRYGLLCKQNKTNSRQNTKSLTFFCHRFAWATFLYIYIHMNKTFVFKVRKLGFLKKTSRLKSAMADAME